MAEKTLVATLIDLCEQGLELAEEYGACSDDEFDTFHDLSERLEALEGMKSAKAVDHDLAARLIDLCHEILELVEEYSGGDSETLDHLNDRLNEVA